MTLRRGAAGPGRRPPSGPVALKPEQSGHGISLDPADLKRVLQWALEDTLLPQPCSLISEITMVPPACGEAAGAEVKGSSAGCGLLLGWGANPQLP